MLSLFITFDVTKETVPVPWYKKREKKFHLRKTFKNTLILRLLKEPRLLRKIFIVGKNHFFQQICTSLIINKKLLKSKFHQNVGLLLKKDCIVKFDQKLQ